MAPLDAQASFAKLKEFFKDYYQNVKQKLTDVSPSEFNEIQMVLNAVISLAREYNLNNKDPEIIALFADEKFGIKNLSVFFSKIEAANFQKILKNKKNTKESIISFNLNAKYTVILI